MLQLSIRRASHRGLEGHPCAVRGHRRLDAVAILAFATLTAPAAAQEITVLQDAGKAVDQGGKTTLEFRGKSGVRMHRVLAKGAGVVEFGGAIYAETTSYLCTTPCTVEVPNSSYELKVGESLLFSPPFMVDARGGAQSWEVEDASSGLGVLGIVGSGAGVGGVAGGIVLMARGSSEAGVPLTLIAAPVAVLGLWALIAAFSDAERVL